MAMAAAYVVKLYRVLSEDPWHAQPIEERRYKEWEEAREAFIERLEELEASGYRCSDYASAWHQMCSRMTGTRRVYVEELGEELEVVVTEKLLLALEPG
ncbi:hypothetical protein [Pyrodictium abyssi]|uniref:Uncharacterized protein n=1 Tax=Pyrodictium abyssi TaxID=54256 RepID=A0ABN6ZQT9_9CREN|nr:hypothetical protein PABY_21450 [Pyrodictium abyssi]